MKIFITMFFFLYLCICNLFSIDKPDIILQEGHKSDITLLKYSPDGKYLVSCSEGFSTIKIWLANDYLLFRNLTSEYGSVTALTFSQDSKHILAGYQNGAIILWEIASGKQEKLFIDKIDREELKYSECFIAKIISMKEGTIRQTQSFNPASRNDIYSICFSKDNKHVFSVDDKRDVKVWELSTGNKLQQYEIKEDTPVYVNSVDSNSFILGYLSGLVEVRDISSNAIIKPIHKDIVKKNYFYERDIHFSIVPDENKMIINRGEDIVLVDISKGIVIKEIKGNNVFLISNNELMLFDSSTGCVKIISTENWHVKEKLFKNKMNISLLSFDKISKNVAIAYDNNIEIWSIKNNKILKQIKGNHDWIYYVKYDKNGERIIFQQPGLFYFFNIKTGEFMRGRSLGRSSVMDYNINNNYMATQIENEVQISADEGKMMKFVIEKDTKALANEFSLRDSSWQYIEIIRFSPDDKHLAASDNYGNVVIWDMSNEHNIQMVDNSYGDTNILTFSKDGKYLVYNKNKLLKVWNIMENRIEKEFKEECNNVDFSPDNLYMAVSSFREGLKIYKINDWTEHEKHDFKYITALKYSYDGKYIAFGRGDKSLEIFDLEKKQIIKRYYGHTGIITSIDFSTDMKHIISGGMDSTVKIWDFEKEKLLFTIYATLNVMENMIEYISYSPENYYISNSGKQLLYFRIGDKLASFDNYAFLYNKPEIIENILQGKEILESEASFSMPPDIVIRSPENGQTFEENEMKLSIEARDRIEGIKSIWIETNGNLYPGSDKHFGTLIENPGEKKYRQDYKIMLQPGENIIKVKALNNNSVSSDLETIIVNYKKTSRKLWLLSIGINKYENEKYNLKYAKNDAEEIERIFKTQEGFCFEEVKTKKLVDEEATRENILNARMDFMSNASAIDTVVFFFAGHGVKNVKGNYYFLTYDASKDNPGLRALSYNDIKDELLSGLPTKNTLLLMDTCHSGEIGRGSNTYDEVSSEMNKFMDNAVVISASTSEGYAMEKRELYHGAFTYSLRNAIIGKADIDFDGKISIFELYKFTAKDVIEITDKRQHPTGPDPDKLKKEDFIIAMLLKKDGLLSLSPKIENKKVTFFFKDDYAISVNVAGSFNGWDNALASYKMIKNKEGIWLLTLELESGRYEYKFYVRGEKRDNVFWTEDKNNQNFIKNDWGTINSVIEIPK